MREEEGKEEEGHRKLMIKEMKAKYCKRIMNERGTEKDNGKEKERNIKEEELHKRNNGRMQGKRIRKKRNVGAREGNKKDKMEGRRRKDK